MCSRITYETGAGTCITGRGMDWNDPDAVSNLWVFPKGMKRDGASGDTPLEWTSKYGSLSTSFYESCAVDGVNEHGLVANVLYLAESDYGDPVKRGKTATLSIAAWAQYMLDNYKDVKEAVKAMDDEPFTVVAPLLPNGRAASGHLSLSDPSGDNAILEYVDGKLVVHHGKDYHVMTNSPVYDQQLALNAYWDLIGGDKMLPGTINPADRFVRLSYFLKASPKFKGKKHALASVFSQMRAIGVPLGMEDPEHPNISSTLWRTIVDHEAMRYYFESATMPYMFWVDVNNLDFSEGAKVMRYVVDSSAEPAGEVSANFKPTEPYSYLA